MEKIVIKTNNKHEQRSLYFMLTENSQPVTIKNEYLVMPVSKIRLATVIAKNRNLEVYYVSNKDIYSINKTTGLTYLGYNVLEGI